MGDWKEDLLKSLTSRDDDFSPTSCEWMKVPQELHKFALDKGPHNRPCLIIRRKMSGTASLLPRSTNSRNMRDRFAHAHKKHSHKCFISDDGWVILNPRHLQHRIPFQDLIPTYPRCFEAEVNWLDSLRAKYRECQSREAVKAGT